MAKPIYVLNGPNLNLLGSREPEIYGSQTLDDLRRAVEAHGQKLQQKIDFRQTNGEGELVGWIQEARDKASGIVLNAGAYSHTSIAILDAVIGAGLPCIEVHLSNIYRRDSFRQNSYVSKAADGIICGLGATGYLLALDALAAMQAGRDGKS